MRNNRKRAATKESPPRENSGGEREENVDELKEENGAADGFGAILEGQQKNQQNGCWGQMVEKREEQRRIIEKQIGQMDGQQQNECCIPPPQLMGGQTIFTLSWRVEWSGTFPVGKICAENLAKRLDSLLGPYTNGINQQQQQKGRLAGTHSILAISPNEIIATAVDNPKLIFLSHPIRKVCCVVGRVETHQLAYITREQPSHSGHHIPYRKQCHVFRTETAFEVEEIESVLSSAFEQALSQDSKPFNDPLQMVKSSPSPKLRLPSASVRDVATSPLMNSSPLKTPKKEKIGGFLERSRSQMRISSSSLIQKIFGTPKKEQKSSPEFKKPPLPSPTNRNVRFRKPRWPLTPLRSCTSSTAFSTPKRPKASATSLTKGFLHPPFPASPPFQSTTMMIDAKRNSATSNSSKFATQQRFSSNSSNHSPPNKQNCIKNDPPSGLEEKSNNNNLRGPSPIELVYDERLKEWIYPIEECMADELERLAYFCGPNEKDYVMEQLRQMPIGHFMLRLSGSRRKCLALSVRVEENEKTNPKGIAHYLVIRNEHGYRIRGSKRYFQSLPMLVTHHSVLAEQLPCRLKLSDWRWTQEPQMARRRQSSGGSTLAALRGKEETIDMAMIRWRKPPLGFDAAQNCRQIEPSARMTSNTLFSSKSSTILSA